MCVSTCDRARTTIFCPPPRPTRRPLLPYTTLFRSQLERATIRERQAEGIAIAKKKGVYARTKRLTPEQITEARERVEAGVAHARVARELSVSRTTLYAALNGSGAYATT